MIEILDEKMGTKPMKAQKQRKGDYQIVQKTGNTSGIVVFLVQRYKTFLWWGWWHTELIDWGSDKYKIMKFTSAKDAKDFIMSKSPKHESHTNKVIDPSKIE